MSQPRPYSMGRRIKEVPCPADTGPGHIRIISAPPSGILTAIALSQRVYGFLLHFQENRKYPCFGTAAFCAGCRDNQVPRWVGYFAGLVLPNLSLRLVEVTCGAYRNCPTLQKAQGDMRGWPWTLRRFYGKKNGPAAIEISGARCTRELRPEPDVTGALLRHWGFGAEVLVRLAEVKTALEETGLSVPVD